MADGIDKKGVLYGVSVGPGDPELITLKAAKCIEACGVIAAPQTPAGNMLALDIARAAVDLSGKTIVPLRFAMSRDKARMRAAHEAAAAAVRVYLDAGRDVAMLNIGDVSIYSTFGHLQAVLRPLGYKTVMIAGVPSFCAVAARLNAPLTGGMDTPLIIAQGGGAGEILDAAGVKALMKSGRKLPQVLEELKARGLLENSAMVCNCGLPDERVYKTLAGVRPDGESGYFATVIVKGE